jgi:hypothetical protein
MMTNEEYYKELKRLDAEQGIADPAESAAGIATQTQTITVDVPNANIRAILASGMEYSKIVLLSEDRDYLATPLETVELAIWAVDFLNSGGTTVANSRDSSAWDTVVANFDALPVISDASMDAIRALRTEQTPVLPHNPSAEDVIAAREQF